MTELTGDALLDVVNSWITNRNHIVDARHTSERAGIFAANQGTHMAFLRQINAHGAMLGGILPAMNPLQVEALQELVSSWASNMVTTGGAFRG